MNNDGDSELPWFSAVLRWEMATEDLNGIYMKKAARFVAAFDENSVTFELIFCPISELLHLYRDVGRYS